MLYDPKWNIKTKINPLSLDALIAWLELQPADTTYRYKCSESCLLAKYFTAQGFVQARVGGETFYHGTFNPYTRARWQIPEGFNAIAKRSPLTFGAALQRARVLAG